MTCIENGREFWIALRRKLQDTTAKPRVLKCMLYLCLFVIPPKQALAVEDYSKSIDKLVEGTPLNRVNRALRSIQLAGPAAFPALLNHLDDKRPCKSGFYQHSQFESNPDGSVKLDANGHVVLHHPTIGEACFDIIQEQIEGNWFGVCQQFYVLTPNNVKQWLAAHEGQKLPQMFASARADSVCRAEAELAAHPNDELLKKCVNFLRANYRFWYEYPN